MLRLEEIRHDAGSPFHAARTEPSRSPPWAPTPGIRKGSLLARRSSATWLGAVAPTTRPTLAFAFKRSAKAATCLYSGSPAVSRCCRSAAPRLEDRHTTYTPRSAYRVNCSIESEPMYGCTVAASIARVSHTSPAYAGILS